MEKVTVLYLPNETLIFYIADIHSPRNENIGKLTFVFLKNFEAAGIVKAFYLCRGDDFCYFGISISKAGDSEVKCQVPRLFDRRDFLVLVGRELRETTI